VAKKTAEPKSVEELVRHALKLAATKPNAKWTGTGAAALFNTKEANHEAAVAGCTKAEAPLLKQNGKVGALTAAGFERIASELPPEEARGAYDQLREELPEDQVGTVARAMAKLLAPGERVAFIQGVIRRTPLAATELTPVLEEAVAAEKVEHEARVAAAAQRKAAEDTAKKALERAIELFEERRQNRLEALRREYEAEGGRAADLPAHVPQPNTETEPKPKHESKKSGPEPTTAEDKDFRRDVATQLASAWRGAWDAKKDEACDYLESAMWNISGLRLVGEHGQHVAYNGREHDSIAGVGSGDKVRIVRPGWALQESAGEYVVLKATIAK
jgi:hypothetical protein